MKSIEAQPAPAADDAGPRNAHRVVFSNPDATPVVTVADPDMAGNANQAPAFSNPG